jgi:protein TonB
VLSGPVAPPNLGKPVISELTGGKLMKRYDPVYPSSAAGVIGEVVLKATIGKDGKVLQVKIVSGHALLAQSAVSAVKRWRYEPFRLNGVPIEIENTIVVNFKALGK